MIALIMLYLVGCDEGVVKVKKRAVPFVKMWADVVQDDGCFVVTLMFEDASKRQFILDEAFESHTLEEASEQITSLADDFKIKRKDLTFSLKMENYRDGTIH